MEIIQIVYNAMSIIIKKELRNDGGEEGKALLAQIIELSNYYKQKEAR